jgi:hypothetical protein
MINDYCHKHEILYDGFCPECKKEIFRKSSKVKYFSIILLFIVLSAIKVFGQKQSLYAQYPNLVFREVFNDEFSTRFNSSIPTAIAYSQGAGVLNGTSSYLLANKSLNGVYTLRITLKSLTINPSATKFFCDFRNPTNTGTGYLTVNNVTITSSSGTNYVDGVPSSTVSATTKEIVISGITIKSYALVFGTRYNIDASYFLPCSIDQIEIFRGTLSASEISNMYLGVHHKDLTLTPLIDFNSTAGQIKDFRGNTITNTATTIKRAGSIWSASFDGSTSKLDFGNIDNLTGDITICGWVKARGYGESNIGRIISNGKLILRTSVGNKNIQLFSDGGTASESSINSILVNKFYFIAITRTASGVTNFYIGDYKTAPRIDNNPNQSSGTPASGTTNIYLGNNDASSTTFNGLMPQIRIYKSILTLQQTVQLWSWSLNGGICYGD